MASLILRYGVETVVLTSDILEKMSKYFICFFIFYNMICMLRKRHVIVAIVGSSLHANGTVTHRLR